MYLMQRQTVVYNRLHFKCAVTDSNIPRWLFVKYPVSLMYWAILHHFGHI